MQNHLQ